MAACIGLGIVTGSDGLFVDFTPHTCVTQVTAGIRYFEKVVRIDLKVLRN